MCRASRTFLGRRWKWDELMGQECKLPLFVVTDLKSVLAAGLLLPLIGWVGGNEMSRTLRVMHLL